MTKKLKINRNGNVDCINHKFVHYHNCVNCEHSFMVSFSNKMVLCKRGPSNDKEYDINEHF